MMIHFDNDGYTTYQTWTNPPGVLWIGRRDGAWTPTYKAAIAAVQWERHPRAALEKWAWWRDSGVLCGVIVCRATLNDLLTWLGCDGGGAVEVGRIAIDGQGGVAVRTGESLAIMAGVPHTDERVPRFTHAAQGADFAEIFGEPGYLLWFDEEGNGPVDGVELQIYGLASGVTDGGSVMIRLPGLGAGGGGLPPEGAREVARQLLAAATWAEQQKKAQGGGSHENR